MFTLNKMPTKKIFKRKGTKKKNGQRGGGVREFIWSIVLTVGKLLGLSSEQINNLFGYAVNNQEIRESAKNHDVDSIVTNMISLIYSESENNGVTGDDILEKTKTISSRFASHSLPSAHNVHVFKTNKETEYLNYLNKFKKNEDINDSYGILRRLMDLYTNDKITHNEFDKQVALLIFFFKDLNMKNVNNFFHDNKFKIGAENLITLEQLNKQNDLINKQNDFPTQGILPNPILFPANIYEDA